MIPEQKMVDMGKLRHRKNQASARKRKQVTATPGGTRDVMKHCVPLLAKAIEKDSAPSSLPGRTRRAVVYQREVDPSVAAFITCRTLFDLLGGDMGATSLFITIGSRIEDEVRFTAYKKEAAGLYYYVTEKIKDSTNYTYRHRVLVSTFNKAPNVKPWKTWAVIDKLHLGARLVEMLALETGLVERRYVFHRGRKKLIIAPTQRLLEAVTKRDAKYEAMCPWFLPMTQKPKPWTDGYDGGYWTYESSLVKQGPMSDGKVDLDTSDLTVLLTAVNAIQSTRWRVNEDVLVVAEELWRMRMDVAGLAPFTECKPPPRPANVPIGMKKAEMNADQLADLKAWKRKAADAYGQEARRASKLIAAAQILTVADMFRHEEQIYFPQQIDWRGRVYPLPIFLDPQGRDLSRGLLKFATGKPVGDTGGEWLAIHGANSWGEDKVSFGERVEWVMQHADKIKSVAADPLADLWWTDADSPFQFLAWCFEWSAFLETDCSPEFVSYLPVSMDGSCNGLQHFSAMLLDQIGGAAVNLVPAGEPQDIYARVAEIVHAKVSNVQTEKIAREWLASGLIDRSIVKRQVMTLPYGATKRGMQWQLTSYLDKVAGGAELPFEDVSAASIWLTEVIWQSLGEVVVAARRAMDFLQACAKATASKKVELAWTTPHGLTIVQRYNYRKEQEVRTQMMGTMRLIIRPDTGKLDKRKQASSISPNFVHSLDAAHLMLTIEALNDSSISWAVVHDSFGCHAGDAALLASTLRLVFVTMYASTDILAGFRKEVGSRIEGELPEVPPMGKLALEQILRSDFFFA